MKLFKNRGLNYIKILLNLTKPNEKFRTNLKHVKLRISNYLTLI